MIRHKVFRFSKSTSWEEACDEVEAWINSNIAPENVVSVMMEDNEERWGDDVLAIWYRESAGSTRQSSGKAGG